MSASFAGETKTMFMLLPVEQIDIGPNVRTTYKENSIAELADNIEACGLMYPPSFQPLNGRYVLMIGGRRFRALTYKGQKVIPAFVADLSADRWEELQLIENIQREDLNAKDLAASVHKLWKRHGDAVKVARLLNKSKSWVSKRLAVAMSVGPLTAELLDSNAKDVEMLYAFATLEKADSKAARALLPELMEKKAGRREVKEALSAAIGKGTEGKAEPKDDDKTIDMFEEEEKAKPEPPQDDRLAKAMEALRMIRNVPGALKPQEKADKMREIAREALRELEGENEG